MKTLGQIAYEAFLLPEPPLLGKLSWEQLDPLLKEHWESAADAVSAHLSSEQEECSERGEAQ